LLFKETFAFSSKAKGLQGKRGRGDKQMLE